MNNKYSTLYKNKTKTKSKNKKAKLFFLCAKDKFLHSNSSSSSLP